MDFERVLQTFRPLFGAARNATIVRLLTPLLALAILTNLGYGSFYLLTGGNLFVPPGSIYLGILGFQLFVLALLRAGHVTSAVLLLIASAWLSMTLKAWTTDGVRDTALISYLLIIILAALVTSWRLALGISVISILAVWLLAWQDGRLPRGAMTNDPIATALELTIVFGLAIAFVLALVDALRRSVNAAAIEEERFRKVFHVSPVAIIITNLTEGRIIDANPAYWQLSGHDPHTSVGRTTFELRKDLTPEVRGRFISDLLKYRSLQISSYDFVTETGEHKETVALYELIEMSGQPAILSMFYDTTEQNRAREALRQSETRLRALVEAVPDMVFEINRTGTIIHFSPSSLNELSLSPEVLVGRTMAEVLPETAAQAAFAVERALDTGQVHAFEFPFTVKGEARTYEARISPAGTDLALAMVRDVTLNKWSESEREKLINELEQKNAELERFTYTASHDLKSPLITIRGFLGFVREDAMNGNISRLDRDIERINDATEKMQRLLSDLLELSRVGRVKNEPESIDLAQLVAEVSELLHGRLSAGNVQIEIAQDLPLIYGDRRRIFEVFQNLIDNAAKFMGDQPAPRIMIGVEGEFNHLPIFHVRDNGIGVDAQFKDRIFGLFNKLNPHSEGTGIGLALVKRIVELHGGRIWVDASPGGGATFHFALPTQPGPAR